MITQLCCDMCGRGIDGEQYCGDCWAAEVGKGERAEVERDEARAEVDRLRHEIAHPFDAGEIAALRAEVARLREESYALSYIVSRWRVKIGEGDPVWHLMHDVHRMRPEGSVTYVVKRCAALAGEEVES